MNFQFMSSNKEFKTKMDKKTSVVINEDIIQGTHDHCLSSFHHQICNYGTIDHNNYSS